MKIFTHNISLILIALIFVAVVPVYAIDVPTVTVGTYKVSPSVLLPGSSGTITITINNTAQSASLTQQTGSLSPTTYTEVRTNDFGVSIENVHLEGNGITVLSEDFDRVGAIGPGQSIPVTFSIQAPDKNGLYYPEVWIDTLGGQSTRYPIPVNVNTALGIQKQAVLIPDSTINGSINPGDEIPVNLTISNTGELLADDVVIKISNVSTEIAPKGTDTYNLGRIDAGEQKTINLVLLSDKQTNPGLIQVPITIRYSTIDGTPLTQPSSIDLTLLGKAEMGIVSVDTSPSPLVESTPFDLTVRIENTGTGDAKQVSATVDLPAKGTKEAFIGKIKPGNDAPALFLLEGMKSGDYPYTLNITYTDDMGVHTLTRQMNLRMPPADNSGSFVLGLIFLAAAVFLAYRYWYLPRKNGDGMFSWVKKN